MIGKKTVFAILSAICIIIYCNYDRKPYPPLGIVYFNIPLIINKSIDEVVKVNGTHYKLFKDGNDTTLMYEKEGWQLRISFDSISHKSTYIGLQPDFRNYEAREFDNSNINDYLNVGSVDKFSNAYDLRVMDVSDFAGVAIEKDIEWDFQNIVYLSVYYKETTIVFDIPNLIDKQIDNIPSLLGKDFSIPTQEKMIDKSNKEMFTTINKNGYELSIAFNPKSKKINRIAIKIIYNKGFDNAKDMLTIGNLDSTSKSYSFVLGRSSSLGNKFNAVTIYPNK